MGKADIEYSTRAVEQLEKLDPPMAERIIDELEEVTWNPKHFLKNRKITGLPYYSCVVGDYRVIIDWKRNEEPEVLFIRRVGHRRNVYK